MTLRLYGTCLFGPQQTIFSKHVSNQAHFLLHIERGTDPGYIPHFTTISTMKGYSTILLLSSPYILEVGMSEGMLGTESLVWVVGTQLHDKVGTPLGSMFHHRTDAQTILVRKVEVHVP